jgi:hypothetical protein
MPPLTFPTVPNAQQSPYLPDTPYLNQAYTLALVARKIAETEGSYRAPGDQAQLSSLVLAMQISLGGATKALFDTEIPG